MSFLRDAALTLKPVRRLYDDRARWAAAAREAQAEQARLNKVNKRLQRRLAKAPDRDAPSRFFHYSTTFDAVECMRRHAASDLEPSPGHLTNFLGVRISPKFFPTILDGRAGEVEPIPLPANWHADIAEWGATLRAVDLAHETFTVLELGCGWGCWMANTGVAARRSGRVVHMIGIEGDEGHVEFAHEAMADNGFAPDQYTLHRGVAAATEGVALFPRVDHSGEVWGLEPVFGASEDERRHAVETGSHDELPMVSMARVIGEHARIDLLHVDIQGGEADLVEGCLPLLSEKVAYMMIGTHSKQIEGELFSTLLASGDWLLEIERPAILDLTHDRGPVVRVDGVQGWRNLRLLPLD